MAQYYNEQCLSNLDWEHGFYCYTNGTASQTCKKDLAAGQSCIEGTDTCQQG